MITLTRSGVASLRRAADYISSTITDDTADDTARGLHALVNEVTRAANQLEDRIYEEERMSHAR